MKIQQQNREGGYLGGGRTFYPHPHLSCLLGSLSMPWLRRSTVGAKRRFLCVLGTLHVRTHLSLATDTA